MKDNHLFADFQEYLTDSGRSSHTVTAYIGDLRAFQSWVEQTYGEAFDAHARVMDAAGYQAHRMNACGYSLGTTFSPNWMDWPMLYHANPVEVQPGMVIFCHMIIFDSARQLAMTLGRTSLISEKGAEPLSTASLEL